MFKNNQDIRYQHTLMVILRYIFITFFLKTLIADFVYLLLRMTLLFDAQCIYLANAHSTFFYFRRYFKCAEALTYL